MAGVRKIIEVSNLTKKYEIKSFFKKEEIFAVKNVNFSIIEGETFSFIGLNGAGKTSIMKCLLNLIQKDFGKIKIMGKENLNKEDFYRIGYLPEISYFPKNLKLKDLMKFYAKLYSLDKAEMELRIKEELERFEILEHLNEKLETFSKGMLQRVGLAQAMLNEPSILLLDEPMSGLDPAGRQKVMEILKTLKEKGTTIILNTHILSDVEKLSDKIAIVHNGEILEIFSIKSKKLEDFYTIKLKAHYPGFHRIAAGEHIKRVNRKELNDLIKELVFKAREIQEIEPEKFDLEKYFYEKIGKNMGVKI